VATIEVARVYEPLTAPPGAQCVLVDRLWPRGVARSSLGSVTWARDVAPSTALRRWYGHDPARFDEFSRRYRAELAAPPAADIVARLARLARRQPVVLLTATRDVPHSAAAVLRTVLLEQQRRRSVPPPPTDGAPA